ncbi:MAG: tRNA pseudouridine(38-40) synthase TruA [Flavobacteriaceae bacterium]
MRYFIQFSYNGTQYHGWQIQPQARSVQQTLTHALNTLLSEKFEITGAGRTDSGVHAQMMYAHFDYERALPENLTHKLNSFLPKDIAVQKVLAVSDEAHARFDATARTYQYHIHQQKNVFLDGLSWFYGKELNVEAMNAAAQLLLSHTDFECFSKVHTEVYTFDCAISEAYWTVHEDRLTFTITANRFLRNMVRAIVGTLLEVGRNQMSTAEFQQVLDSKNRSEAGVSVPAHGLYLTNIVYPYVSLHQDIE